MKFNEIQDLIKLVSRSNVNEVEIEQNDTRITIRSDGAKKKKKGQKDEEEKSGWEHGMPFPVPYGFPPMPAQGQAPMPQAPPQAAQEAPPAPAPQQGNAEQSAKEEKAQESAGDDSNYVTVKAPMIGTFYRSPSPDKDPYVNVGDSVKEGDVLCVIEAMKLFNEIEAEQSGKIVKVLADDASPVEYDQPLFLIDPS